MKTRLGGEASYVHPRTRTTRRLREFARADELAEREIRNRFIVNYEVFDGGNKVIRRGIDEHKHSLYMVLDRVKKGYKISSGTLEAGKYD